MTAKVEHGGGRGGLPWRIIGWGTAAFLLLLPLITGAPWTLSDYVVMGVLFGIVGLGIELVVRMSDNLSYRIGAGVAILASFLTIWVNLAVGMIGSEGNVLNLMFAGVLFIGLLGAVLARFRPAGMAGAMAAAATAQALAGAVGTLTDVRGGIFSALFAGLWLLSAAFFRNAARDRASERSAS